MADQTNNLLLLDFSDGVTRTIDTAAPDVIQVGVDWEFISGSNVTISGNLNVQGTTTTVNSEIVNIADNHLYLNDGYTTAAAQTGGLVVNYLPTATTDTVAATGFTAGVPATSNPTVITTGSATFSVGDFIQISGANDQQNDGLFEVLSHVGTTLTIRGVGLTATVEDFTQNDFVTDTTVAGAITNVNVSVFRAGTDGIFETALGSTTGLSFSDIGSGAGNSLQQAYVQGETITTDTTNGDITFTGTEDFLVTLTDVDMDVSGTLVFDATTSITMGGDADDSSISIGTATTAGRAITMGNATGTTTLDFDAGTGGVDVDSVGAVTVNTTDAAAPADITLTGGAATAAGAGASVNSVAGAGNDTGAGGDVTMTAGASGAGATGDGGDVTVLAGASAATNGAGGAVSLTTGAGAGTGDSGDVDVVIGAAGGTGSHGVLDVSSPAGEDEAIVRITTTGTNGDSASLFVGDSDPSGSVTGDAASLFFRDTGAGAELYLNTSTGAGTTWSQLASTADITLQQAYVGGETITTNATEGDVTIAGTEDLLVTLSDVDIDVTATVAVDASTSITIGGDADDSSIGIGTATTAGRAISVGNATGTTSIDMDAGTGGVTIDTADGGAVSIDAVGAPSNFTLTSTAAADDLTIAVAGATDSSLILSSTGTGTDALQITASAGGIVMTGIDNDAAAIDINAGGLDYITIDSTDDAEAVELHQFVDLQGEGMGVTLQTGTTGTTAGDLVTIEDGTNDIIPADSNVATFNDRLVVGIALDTAASGGNDVRTVTVPGSRVPMRFGAAPAAGNNGDRVYLSATGGEATLTAPTSSGNAVFFVGYLIGGDGVSTTPDVIYQPQFIARIP